MSPERFIDHIRAEQESLRRFLLVLCGGDSQEADDIAQDALIRAYVASSSFLGLSKFSTWLFRIAYNCYIDNSAHGYSELPITAILTGNADHDLNQFLLTRYRF